MGPADGGVRVSTAISERIKQACRQLRRGMEDTDDHPYVIRLSPVQPLAGVQTLSEPYVYFYSLKITSISLGAPHANKLQNHDSSTHG